MTYIENKASNILKEILYQGNNIKVKGIFKENNYWIAFDNTSGDCFVEEFSKEKNAIAWVNNCFEISDNPAAKVIQLLPNLYYVFNKGLLKTSQKNKAMESKFISINK